MAATRAVQVITIGWISLSLGMTASCKARSGASKSATKDFMTESPADGKHRVTYLNDLDQYIYAVDCSPDLAQTNKVLDRNNCSYKEKGATFARIELSAYKKRIQEELNLKQDPTSLKDRVPYLDKKIAEVQAKPELASLLSQLRTERDDIRKVEPAIDLYDRIFGVNGNPGYIHRGVSSSDFRGSNPANMVEKPFAGSNFVSFEVFQNREKLKSYLDCSAKCRYREDYYAYPYQEGTYANKYKFVEARVLKDTYYDDIQTTLAIKCQGICTKPAYWPGIKTSDCDVEAHSCNPAFDQ